VREPGFEGPKKEYSRGSGGVKGGGGGGGAQPS